LIKWRTHTWPLRSWSRWRLPPTRIRTFP
jgi:hypothetical protein